MDEVVREGLEVMARAAHARGADEGAFWQAAEAFVAAFRAKRGPARVTRHEAAGGAAVWLVEPDMGCSACLMEAGETLVLVDGGFACCREEMLSAMRGAVPDFDARRRLMLLTHADVDHSGLCALADEVWMSGTCLSGFVSEAAGGPNLRDRDAVQGAYERVIRHLTGYATPPLDRLRAVGRRSEGRDAPLAFIGEMTAGGLRFEAWEGLGGHAAGECVYIERRQRIAFTGDVFCNLKAQTPAQAAFNALSPILLGSVDDNKALAAMERRAFFDLLDEGEWQVFGGHGGRYVFTAT